MKKLGLLTVAEAADYLNMPRPTLYQHLREGQIPGIQIGGRWRIELDKLNEFIGKARGSSGEVATIDTDPPLEPPSGTTNSSVEFAGDAKTEIERLRKENARLRAIVAEQLLQLHTPGGNLHQS